MSVDQYSESVVVTAQELLSSGKSQKALDELLSIFSDSNGSSDYWFTLGAAYAETGNLPDAEKSFIKASELNPGHLPAFNSLGRAYALQGKLEQAVKPLEYVISVKQDYMPAVIQLIDVFTRLKKLGAAENLCNTYLKITNNNAEIIARLGVIRNVQKRFDEAIALFDQALLENPSSFIASMNKGVAFQSKGKLDEAIDIFKNMVNITPNMHSIWHVLGVAFIAKKDIHQAIECFEKACQISPAAIDSADLLAKLYRQVDGIDDSIDIYKQILKVQPENIKARYYVDAHIRQINDDKPERIPVEITRQMYSGSNIGESFDISLKQQLNYQAPDILNQAVREMVDIPEMGMDILELGCGSGLCGSLFRDISNKLVGTDLSSDMLVAANRKNTYDELYEADLVDVLSDSSVKYDMIIAMDVLCFFSDLSSIFENCSHKLTDGGTFAFSVVKPKNETEFELNNYGHFAHSLHYLTDISEKTGLIKIYSKELILRREIDVDHYGYVCLFKKA